MDHIVIAKNNSGKVVDSVPAWAECRSGINLQRHQHSYQTKKLHHSSQCVFIRISSFQIGIINGGDRGQLPSWYIKANITLSSTKLNLMDRSRSTYNDRGVPKFQHILIQFAADWNRGISKPRHPVILSAGISRRDFMLLCYALCVHVKELLCWPLHWSESGCSKKLYPKHTWLPTLQIRVKVQVAYQLEFLWAIQITSIDWWIWHLSKLQRYLYNFLFTIREIINT